METVEPESIIHGIAKLPGLSTAVSISFLSSGLSKDLTVSLSLEITKQSAELKNNKLAYPSGMIADENKHLLLLSC